MVWLIVSCFRQFRTPSSLRKVTENIKLKKGTANYRQRTQTATVSIDKAPIVPFKDEKQTKKNNETRKTSDKMCIYKYLK
jgi:hypothetical protein